jgi:DNA topoisomerase-1
MAKNLVIVESPAKCRTISKYLGKDFTVMATMGHIIDLPEKELGVDIANDFKPKYTPSKGKRRILKALRDEADACENVFLAPDPDREGEAIAWHVAQSIAKNNTNVKRVLFNEITKHAVLEAFNHTRAIDENKVNAQQARRILDRIVGYQVSPLLWRTVFRGLSAGRVQSVALRIICERDNEIDAFTTEEYWSIEAQLTSGDRTFRAMLQSVDGQKAALPDAATTSAIVARVKDKPFAVKDVARSEKVRKPYAPFITSTMQQEASRKIGFSAAKTMLVAQQLYEGLELGAMGTLGLITYMRTDSTRIADEAIASVRTYIGQRFGARHLPDAPRTYGKSKNAQDAHEAIRPSQISEEFNPDNVAQYLTRDQQRLYDLIWKRFVASQMNNAIFDAVRADIIADGCIFRATGSVQKFDGFLALYDETREDTTTDESDGQNATLPDLTTGSDVSLKELIDKQHFTQPPPRYTEASLVRELEDKGIGRPSTYAQIIDTLKRRKYVEVTNKRFFPTEVGFMVKKILTKKFPDVFDVNFTAGMENLLDKIEKGEADWISVLREFYTPFNIRLEAARLEIKELRSENQEVTDRTCPKCEKFPLVIKWSKNGKFLACHGFPACKYTEPLQKAEARTTTEVCDKCGAPMVILNVKNNRFLGCSRYPECKSTRSLSTGVHCPNAGCPGHLIERTTRRGKTFYGCSAHPACLFATWDLPVDRKCESCGYPIMVYKESKRKGNHYRCPQCRAELQISPEGESGAPVDQSTALE